VELENEVNKMGYGKGQKEAADDTGILRRVCSSFHSRSLRETEKVYLLVIQ
jgi:hypothetical protein